MTTWSWDDVEWGNHKPKKRKSQGEEFLDGSKELLEIAVRIARLPPGVRTCLLGILEEAEKEFGGNQNG